MSLFRGSLNGAEHSLHVLPLLCVQLHAVRAIFQPWGQQESCLSTRSKANMAEKPDNHWLQVPNVDVFRSHLVFIITLSSGCSTPLDLLEGSEKNYTLLHGENTKFYCSSCCHTDVLSGTEPVFSLAPCLLGADWVLLGGYPPRKGLFFFRSLAHFFGASDGCGKDTCFLPLWLYDASVYQMGKIKWFLSSVMLYIANVLYIPQNI